MKWHLRYWRVKLRNDCLRLLSLLKSPHVAEEWILYLKRNPGIREIMKDYE